jgi:uncharacterized membrane protein YkvA (DUF1232 family)
MKLPFYDWYRNIIRHSQYRWLIILATAAYLFSPIDLLPDVIPLIGQIDDTVILGLLVAEVSSMLMDRLKAQKVDETDPVAASVTPNPTKSATTVEVNATSVK